ncbi:hypothetical protein [Paenibacillus glucanolyticus]|uniref:hypothetical protein n=1 Tax=Paenibacillus glucanolyticus TaxID=59843 RepID=UPI00096EBF56|nr:hypothetical protein [Paenibacillus glucanolyticus]OMF76663.1 hypothetical protein BK142_14155 [Paenibacillus glucanolyticus]
MNYAQLKFPEGERLIHANELAALHDYHEKDIEIHRTKLGVKKILAGTIKLNQHCDLDLESQYYTTSDFAYLTGNRCNLFKIIDIRIAENNSFVALVQGEISIPNQPIAAFKRDNDLSIRDNIIQRSCLLSFEHEIGQDQKLSKENWIEIVIKALESVEEKDETDLEIEWGIRYKDRQEVLDTVFQQENIFTATHYTYHLTHTYDREPRRILLTSTIEPYTMDLLIAYIQFVASDIDMHYSVDQEDVIRVVKDLYSNQAQINTNVINLDPTPCEIDLHINWEWWCGQSDRIMSHKLFHNDTLQNMLEEIIRKNKERR